MAFFRNKVNFFVLHVLALLAELAIYECSYAQVGSKFT
jgi:hypothetical protein